MVSSAASQRHPWHLELSEHPDERPDHSTVQEADTIHELEAQQLRNAELLAKKHSELPLVDLLQFLKLLADFQGISDQIHQNVGLTRARTC